jgi:hypothetical protein
LAGRAPRGGAPGGGGGEAWSLPPESGQRLRQLVESEEFGSILGEAFALERADIEQTVIRLAIRGRQGDFARITLRAARPEPAPGRWFELVEADSSSPRAEATLQAAARYLERGFAKNPFRRHVQAGGGEGSPRPSPPGCPRWLFVLLGWAQWLLIAAALFAAFAMRPPEARRN